MSDCFFSVITICYNEIGSIRSTCDSIVSQSFKDFDWIVIDGASTDGTFEILREYSSLIRHLVSEPDAGIYNAMNKGAAMAFGEYLIFMNGGDSFAHSRVLERVACSPSADLLVGNVLLGENGQVRSSPKVLSKDYLMKNMLPHQATFFRRDLFERYGLFDESYRIAGDYEMFARLVCRAGVSYRHMPALIAVFDEGGISASQAQRSKRKQENHRVRWKYFPAYRYSLKGMRQLVRNWIKRS